MRIAIILLFICSFVANVFAASENLDEIATRKTRLAVNSWGKTYVENPTTLVWQPETLAYADSDTGVEVWRLSSTNGIKNSLPDITWSHWSADGKRFSFGSNRDTSANSSAYETNDNSSYQGAVMMMRADGTFLRPAKGGPFEVYVHSRYLHWSPTEPDVYYGFGRNYAGEGLNDDDLYRVVVGDTSISKTKILDMGIGSEINLKKAMSSDGTKLVVHGGADKFYPIALNGGTATLDDADGWNMYRQLDDYWGNTPTNTSYTIHDQFLLGTGTNHKLYFIPEGQSSWWRYALSGSASDGGPALTIDNTAPYDWGGAIEPVFTGFASGGACTSPYRSPWNCDSDSGTGPEQYMSHPGFDRWGKYVAGVNAQQYQAWGVWDLGSHSWVDANIEAPHYNWHLDWEAWSDYFAASPTDKTEEGIIYTVKYDGTDSVQVASAHIRESNSTDYNSLPRGTQSPDGTKIVFHSDFLYNVADTWDMFYAVAYYPHPPEIISVSSGVVRFDWRTDQATSRGYTQRGWPSEATDDPPPPRETNKFRLWKSANGTTGWTPVGTVDAEIFTKYNFSTGAWTGNKYWEITDPSPSGFYAVTAVEHSGLESRVLSNVFNAAGSQTAAYPADPKAGTGVTSTYQSTAVRYYNIYAHDGSAPTVQQQQRIASIPVASGTTYLDWLGNTDGTTQYKVTAVDTQGNESGELAVTYVHQATVGQYRLNWDSALPQSVLSASGSFSIH
jgi:hypothetical protein